MWYTRLYFVVAIYPNGKESIVEQSNQYWFTRNQAKLDAENLAKSIRHRTKGLPVTPIVKTKIEEVTVNENELDRLRAEGKVKEG
ncbi:hypothetical protein [Aneurinibacillus tyrosinisolvens]|uniref:hypothetical protein n=1 Tax=Aneurinibacillus tyrosinisolvens TaxID=1443435 RepID=UPI00063F3CC5|nr:hypothetical protein [Aneurinibacillus tyrosinisolvens]